MSKIILYIAASLDGFIARTDGDFSWLEPFEQGGEDYGYHAFYDSIGAIIMGGNTYRQVAEFAKWPYPGVTSYVVTHRPVTAKAGIKVVAFSGDVRQLVEQVKAETPKDIWLEGGGVINGLFARYRLIDEMDISVIPLMLGEGIPLFQGGRPEATLELLASQAYPNGVLRLRYRVTGEKGYRK